MRAYFKEFIGQSEPVSVGKLKDYCSMQYGYTETATNEPIGSKFLRITDIAQSYIDWSAVPYCPITDDNHARGESAGPPARRFPRAPAPRDRPAPDASRSVSARSLKSVRTVILRGDSPLWKRQ